MLTLYVSNCAKRGAGPGGMGMLVMLLCPDGMFLPCCRYAADYKEKEKMHHRY